MFGGVRWDFVGCVFGMGEGVVDGCGGTLQWLRRNTGSKGSETSNR